MLSELELSTPLSICVVVLSDIGDEGSAGHCSGHDSPTTLDEIMKLAKSQGLFQNFWHKIAAS